MIKGCFKHVPRRFQGCVTSVSRVVQESLKYVSRVFERCFKKISKVFYPSFNEVSRGSKERVFQETFKFQGCFRGIGRRVWRSSQAAFGRLTGNDVSGHYKRHFFFFFFFSSPLTFLIEGVLGSKKLFCKS